VPTAKEVIENLKLEPLPGEGGYFRRNHWVPVPQGKDLEELNAQLLKGCLEDQQRQIAGVFEPGRSMEEKTSTVHYIKFPLTPEQIEAFQDESTEVHLVVNHPNYRASAKIASDVRNAWIEDLQTTTA